MISAKKYYDVSDCTSKMLEWQLRRHFRLLAHIRRIEANMLVSVKEIRRSLGNKKAKRYTDDQIEGAIRTAEVLSDLMIDFFIERGKQRKQQRKDTQSPDKKEAGGK